MKENKITVFVVGTVFILVETEVKQWINYIYQAQFVSVTE